MPHCNELSNEEMNLDSIFEIECPGCRTPVEFFEDDNSQNCPECNMKIRNPRYRTGACYECFMNKDSNYISRLCQRFQQSKRDITSNFLKLYK